LFGHLPVYFKIGGAPGQIIKDTGSVGAGNIQEKGSIRRGDRLQVN
jgi:hypothetical protein